jgi:hypothetical protein
VISAGQQEIARGMQYLRPIGKDKSEVDVRRGLFPHACERRQNYPFGLSFDHFMAAIRGPAGLLLANVAVLVFSAISGDQFLVWGW